MKSLYLSQNIEKKLKRKYLAAKEDKIKQTKRIFNSKIKRKEK